MNRLILAAAMLAPTVFLPACADSYRPPHNTETITTTPTGGQLEGHPVLSMPIWIPGSKTSLVPLAMQSHKGLFQDDDPYTRGGVASGYYTSRSMPASAPATDMLEANGRLEARWVAWDSPAEVRWHNVIVHETGAPDQLMLDRRGIIGRWQIFGAYDQHSGKQEVRGILFIAVLADTNHDKSLDNLDARVAIVTDPAGRHPRTISPPEAQVWTAAYNLETNALYMLVVKDTTGDGKFQFDDDPVPYEWKLGSDGPAVPLVSDEAVKRALSYLK